MRSTLRHLTRAMLGLFLAAPAPGSAAAPGAPLDLAARALASVTEQATPARPGAPP
jgi:hypothetical protein